MSSIRININGVKSANLNLRRAKNNISSLKSKINSLKYNMDLDLRECGNINSNFRKVSEIISSLENRLESIINVSNNGIERYKSVDKSLARYKGQAISGLVLNGLEIRPNNSYENLEGKEGILSKDTKDVKFEENDDKEGILSWLGLLFSNKLKSDEAKVSGSDRSETKAGNVSVSHEQSGGLLGYEAGITTSINGKGEDGTAYIGTKGEASGYIAKGKMTGSIGIASASSGIAIGSVGVSGEAQGVLFKDGKFNPQAALTVGAEAEGITGNIDGKLGSDKNNIHIGASGTVGTAKAEASCAIGLDGVGASAEVGAAVFKGEVKTGFTILGVNFDFTLEGEAMGVGAKVEAGILQSTNATGEQVTTLEIGGKLTALLGLGLNLKISW